MDPVVSIFGISGVLAALSAAAWFVARRMRLADAHHSIRIKQESIESIREELISNQKRSKESSKHLESLNRQAGFIRQRAKKKKDNKRLDDKLSKISESTKLLEEEIVRRRKEIGRLSKVLSKLERESNDLQARLDQIEVKNAIKLTEDISKSSKRTNQLLEKVDSDLKKIEAKSSAVARLNIKRPNIKRPTTMERVDKLIDLVEKDVERKESKAMPPLVTQFDEGNLKDFERAIEKMAEMRYGLNSSFDSLKRSLVITDPSVEAAFKQLCEQVQSAKADAELSLQQETELEQRIQNGQSDKNKAELENVLKVLRRKNVAIRHTLLRVDDVVRRLRVLQLLFSAHPELMDKHSAEYQNAIQVLLRWVDLAVRNGPEGDEESKNILSQLSSVESAALMAYIDLVKRDAPILKEPSFQASVRTVHSTLSMELSAATAEINHWATVVDQAQENQMELLGQVATERKKSWSEYERTVRQTSAVLDLITKD